MKRLKKIGSKPMDPNKQSALLSATPIRHASWTYNKMRSIAELGDLFRKAEARGAPNSQFGSAIGCELRVFIHPEHKFIYEMISVEYFGGERAYRNATMNSTSADFKEIGELLNGGYYWENEDMEELETKWYELTFDSTGVPTVLIPETEEYDDGEGE